MPGDPFQIDFPPFAPTSRAAMAAARPLLDWILGLHTYRQLYRQVQELSDAPFVRRALHVLDITPRVSTADLARIPPHGPVVIVSNHPHGLVDGLVLAEVIGSVRPDVRVLTNVALARIRDLSDVCFFVDPFGGSAAAARSRAGLRAARRWLTDGGALVAFPAGEVAHRPIDGARIDSPWSPAIARLAEAAGAPIVPAFIDGANRDWFYAAGRIHPALRTLLLGRAALAQRGRTIRVRVGSPLAQDGSTADERTLGARVAVDALRVPRSPRSDKDEAIAGEIARLPREACLIESGAFQVFCARARQIPRALVEIGRLREIAYRAVGEGTGRVLDLDRFDQRYLHLFVWDRRARRIVGAYRIGETDRLIATGGVDALYTRTLFRYDHRLIDRLDAPALELGRSFVRLEYQKNYNALLLLWKGIGRFIAAHPQYRFLFGPVSISRRYSDTSHQLLMAFLQQNRLDRDLAALVEAINPARMPPAPPASTLVAPSIDDVDRLVSRAEHDGKGVPVLLRQYLKLNARMIAFNVDPAFGEALDALMIVDLAAIDPAILTRYMGRDAARFLAAGAGVVRGFSLAPIPA